MIRMVRGGCLCGGVRFEVEPPFIRASHCHCDRCRKHSGTSVCTQARVGKEQFHLLAGEDLICVYGKGEGAGRVFVLNAAQVCFGGEWPEGPQVSIRMGAFDDDPRIRPQFYTYVDDGHHGTRLPTIFRNTAGPGVLEDRLTKGVIATLS